MQLVTTVLMCLIWGLCIVSVIWLGFLLPVRKAKAALQPLESALGLAPGLTSSSLWPATREQFTWTSWPLLEGSRGPYRVEITVQPGLHWHSALTTVVVAGPRSVGARVLLSRQPEMMTFSKHALNPFARGLTGGKPGDLRSFVGEARVFYDSAALERVLDESLRAELIAFPGQWMNVGVDGSAMLIAWWGVESDPAIVERAFRIAATHLARLSERRATPVGMSGAARPAR
jgi:hypothetical protein